MAPNMGRRHTRRSTHRSRRRRRSYFKTHPAGNRLPKGGTLGDSAKGDAPTGLTPSTAASWWDHRATTAPAALAALLLGTSIAMACAGLAARTRMVFGHEGAPSRAALAGGLLALAVGVGVPQRLAMWLCVVSWRRFLSRGRASDVAVVALNPREADRPLYWTVLSVLALIGGVATALLPLSARIGDWARSWIGEHFVESVAPLDIKQIGFAFLVGFASLAALGVAVSCVHHLSCAQGRWETKATGWLLIGASLGATAASWLGERESGLSILLVAASIPVFLVSLLSVSVGSAVDSGPSAMEPCATGSLPTWSDRWPRLLRASTVAVGGGSACAVVVWAEQLRAHDANVGLYLPVPLLALGLGVLAGSRTTRRTSRSIGGFGVACASAGVVIAATTVVLRSTFSAGPWRSIGATWVGLMAISYAAAYGRKTLLNRVASRSFEGARMTVRLFLCTAFTLSIGAPLAIRCVGAFATLIMLALSLLAVGGLLIIHEPAYSPATRRIRLCALFGSIGAMIVLAAFPSNPWR